MIQKERIFNLSPKRSIGGDVHLWAQKTIEEHKRDER
jgi:hypothetical protein